MQPTCLHLSEKTGKHHIFPGSIRVLAVALGMTLMCDPDTDDPSSISAGLENTSHVNGGRRKECGLWGQTDLYLNAGLSADVD